MKIKLSFWVVLLINTFNINLSVAQKLFTVPQLQADFQLFQQALEEAHPGLYRYTKKQEFDSIFSYAIQKIDHSMDQQEFYKLLLLIVGQIKCGHTKFHPDHNWATNFYYNIDKVFPWRLHFNGEKAFIMGDYNNSVDIPIGAELVSIEEKPISEIISEMLPAFLSDGNNTTFKYWEMDHYFSAYYANLFNGPESFLIAYRTPKGLKEIQVASISHLVIEQYKKNHKIPQKSNSPYSFELISDETALLTIASFWEEVKNMKYRKFLKKSFKEIKVKGVKNLIIDLRNNEGGIDKRGAELMAYLTDEKFGYYDRLEMTTNKKFSFTKEARLPKFYGIRRLLISKAKDGTYRWTHHKNLKTQKPQKNHFEGKVYVLINGASFSVTSEFAAVAHYMKRATFIGEETGGGYYGNNSGAFAIVNLANTKLNIGIPLMAYYSKVEGYPYPNRGVIPDYEVKPSVDDLIKSRDNVMDYTLKLISK